MASEIFDIDHLMLSVQNTDLAMDVFCRMGFSITPRGVLEGMNNRLICFEGRPAGVNGKEGEGGDGEEVLVPNFVEFMSLDDPEKAPPPMVRALENPDRPVLLVAATRNAVDTRKSLQDLGLEVFPVIDTGREWKLPDGQVLDLTFSIVLPAPGQAPFNWIACQHKTPHHYLRPDFTTHANGALALKNVIGVARDPRQASRHYHEGWNARVSGENPVVVARGDVELHIYDQKGFGSAFAGITTPGRHSHLAGFTVLVRDLVSLEQRLESSGFSPFRHGDRVIVDPSKACGSLVVFEAA